MRRSTVGLALAVLVTAGSAFGFLFWTQTDDITPTVAVSPAAVAPGETFVIEVGADTCMPTDDRAYVWYRETWFGRWQQTHVGLERDVVHWYDIGERDYVFPPDCQFGPVELTVPRDITWSAAMVCREGNVARCAELRVR